MDGQQPITHTILEQVAIGDELQTTIHHVDPDGNDVAEVTSTHQRLNLRVEDFGTEHVLAERAA